MVTVRVTSLDYTTKEGKPVVRVAARSETGDRRVFHANGHNPYIFVPESDPVPDQVNRHGVESGYESYDGQPLKKIDLIHPDQSNDDKDDYVLPYFSDSFEADIPYFRRVSLDGLHGHINIPDSDPPYHITDIDFDAEGNIDPRICILDIEVLPSGQSIETMKENAQQPVVCMTLWDSYDDEYWALVLEKYDEIDVQAVQNYLQDHWDDQSYASPNVVLKRCQTERDLLNQFVQYIQQKRVDLISGWNAVNFDTEYLIRRMRNVDGVNTHELSDVGSVGYPGYNTERVIDGLPAFDMMESFERMMFENWRSKALDYVAQEKLGVGKVEGIDIQESFDTNLSRLLAYNIIDVQLCVAIERQHDLFDFWFRVAEMAGIPIHDTISELRICDGYLLSRRDDDEVLPDMTEYDDMGNAGALVLSPSTGIQEWVGVLDVSSLYPSVIITCNISPETVVESDGDVTVPAIPEHADDVGGRITESDIDWSDPILQTTLETEGVIPKYLREMFGERNRYKRLRDQHDPDAADYEKYDIQQAAVKVIMNSLYGNLSSPWWRLAVPGLGDAVTGGGRYVLWRGSDTLGTMGYETVYGDTDSCLISLKHDEDERLNVSKAEKRLSGIETQLNDSMDAIADDMGIGETHPFLVGSDLHGTDRHCIEWEGEKIFERYLQGGKKKRYAGKTVFKDGKRVTDISITGFESQRSDIPPVAADAQEEIIGLVLSDCSFKQVSDCLRDYIETLRSDFDPLEHGIPSVINQPIEEYPNRPVKRAVKYSNEHLDYTFSEGDNPWLVYVDDVPSGLPQTDVIACEWNEDLPDGFTVDTKKHREKCFEQPLDAVLEIVGWDFTELMTGNQSQSVDEWGGGSDGEYEVSVEVNTDQQTDDGTKLSESDVDDDQQSDEDPFVW